jgi:hypothetical protein
MIDKRVGVASKHGSVYSCGVGRIAIPYGLDRDSFVKQCYIDGMVSVQPELNNLLNRVRIDRDVLQQIEFPASFKELGSLVVYVNLPKTHQPIVVACVDSITNYGDLNENQFRIRKVTEFGSVSIFGDGKGNMSINVDSQREKRGRFDISIVNPDNTAEFNVITKGTTNIYSSGKISVRSSDEIALEATDGSDTSKVTINKDTVSHNEGNEPMLLGQTTIDLLQDLIQLIATGIATSGAPLSTAPQITQLASSLNSLLSEKSKLD